MRIALIFSVLLFFFFFADLRPSIGALLCMQPYGWAVQSIKTQLSYYCCFMSPVMHECDSNKPKLKSIVK